MDKHLFKLKKDGKCVGYLKIAGAQVFYGLSLVKFQSWPIDIFKRIIKTPNLRSLSSYPFVTKDKHGKDVFAGDRVRRINGEPCFVEWFADECRYVLHNNENYYDIDILELEQGIELIEEKEDG